MSDRIETGALQIDDDWTGLFIRGDDALYLSDVFETIYKGGRLQDFEKATLYNLHLTIKYDVTHTIEERYHVQKIERKGE